MKPRLYWVPANDTGTRWHLMFEFEWTRRIAVLHRSLTGGWEVPVSGGAYTFSRDAIDAAVERAEREGCGTYGILPPHWRMERSRLTKAATRASLRA